MSSSNHQPSLVACKAVTRDFTDGDRVIAVLKGIDLSVKPGENIAIVGPSGSGKTTLMHLLGGLDKPTSGDVFIQQASLNTLDEAQLCELRNTKLGFIYQFHHLLPEFTAIENVMMPLLIAGNDLSDANNKASELLQKVGLGHRLEHKPAQLSGGERQRTAIARALVANPLCVLADEPTGNLDQQTAETIYELLFQFNESLGTSFIIATHDMVLARRMDRIVYLLDGVVISESESMTISPAA